MLLDELFAQDLMRGLEVIEVDFAVFGGVTVQSGQDPLHDVVTAAETLFRVDGDTQLEEQVGCVTVGVPLLDGVLGGVERLLRDLQCLRDKAHTGSSRTFRRLRAR